MAPLRQSSTGSITPIIGWPHYGDYGVARLRRSWNGTIAAIINSQQELERRYRFQARGYDLDWLLGQVASLLNLDHGVVTRRGRYPDTVEARSVFCYWAARELGISTLELSRKLGISQPTASQSAKRGERIVKEKRLKLMG